jgi:hypothetical protein
LSTPKTKTLKKSRAMTKVDNFKIKKVGCSAEHPTGV